MKSVLLAAALCLAAAGGLAQTAQSDPGAHLVLRYGGVRIVTGDSLLLMDGSYKAIVDALRDPKTERTATSETARFATPLSQVVRTVTQQGDVVEVRYVIDLKPEPRGRFVELNLAVPAAVAATFESHGKSHDALRSAEELTVPSLLGELRFDVRGSTSPWSFDDMRRAEWSKAFRLRFAPGYDPAKGLQATAVLRFQPAPTRAAAWTDLDVAAAGNRGLRDDVADDGQGGWTDQGANDLRCFKPGRYTFSGVPLRVGEQVAVLRGGERPKFPAASPAVPVGAKVARLYLLHTCAWSAGHREPIAEYVVDYADGQTAVVPVRYGVEVCDWWGAAEAIEARLAWSGDNGQATVGLHLARWSNPRPDVAVKTVTMRSRQTAAVPVWLGATALLAGAAPAEQTQYLDAAWSERREPTVNTADWFACPIAWRDGIEPGSALDVSALNEAPAGKQGFLKVKGGHFVFERGDDRPVRFWGTNAALYGPFPEQSDAPGIARCLARQGVNMVRLHLYAVYENTMIAKDGSLDAAALDRFEFYIAQLKAQGIYCYMDLNDGMFYDRLVGRKLPVGNEPLKMVSLFNRELIDAQKKLARDLFSHRNPHTGLRLCDDPAIALYEITNENSMTMGWGALSKRVPEPYYSELRGLWTAWLQRQGKPARDLPTTLGEQGADDDSRRFGAELQRRYLEEMRECFRQIGVKAPISGTNITFTLGDLWASENMDYTGDHGYADHPNVGVRPMTFANLPTVTAPAHTVRMIPTFARGKVAGKPLVAGEWNWCFPNDYRCEGMPQMSAYSAYQDWDALLFYCATGSFDGGRWERFRQSPNILIHSQQTDPATWGLSQISALLYRRGDVRVAQQTVRLAYGPSEVWSNRTPLSRLPFLPAVARVEAELVPQAPTGWLTELGATAAPAELFSAVTKRLQISGCSDDRVTSDTGEIVREPALGILRVDTPRTQMASGFLAKVDEVALGNLSVSCGTRFATVALSSLDGQPLERSGRMLLTAVANARNTGQQSENRRLLDGGKVPVIAEPVQATLRLKARQPEQLRVHQLDPLTGRRLATVATKVDGQRAQFAIGQANRTIYYEVVR